MEIPLLATGDDVEADLGRSLTTDESPRLWGLVAKASAIVVGYTGRSFDLKPYPPAVVAVVAGMVARAISARTSGGGETESQNAGPFGVTFVAGSTSTSPYLSAADKLVLKSFRRSGGMTSVGLVGERYVIQDNS